MNKMHRAQILLESDQHQKLAEIAQHEGTSISEIVRTAVQEWLDERKDDEILRHRLEALELIDQHRQAILARRKGKPLEIDLTATIEQVRGERDNELIDSAAKHRN
jgi:metal-responsive CopG/Arc/MetJ family transcriptional regulator